MKRRLNKTSGLLTPSQEAVHRFVGQSSRWLTIYEISKLTGVSRDITRSTLKYLLDRQLVSVRKRIHGWENGEREFKSVMFYTGARQRTDKIDVYRLYGVETVQQKLSTL